VQVPDVTGMSIAEVESNLQNLDLVFEVTDSVFSDEVPRGVVVSQNPTANSEVKHGRTLFLSVNSILPEMVEMPDLMGKSRRIALPLIEITGLKLGELKYQPDESCTDCVVGQEYEGKLIQPGTKIRKGQEITLILGKQSNDETAVPDLLGMRYQDAIGVIQSNSLNNGDVIYCTGCETAEDTLNAFVLNQIPNRGDDVKLGSFVDVYLSTDSAAARAIQTPKDTLVP
jgi:beta-lactam-binding protein with PASTA domain